MTSLPSVDVSRLTDSERAVWVELINELLSPCGDPVSIGQCAGRGSGRCAACTLGARYLQRLVEEGYDRTQIEEHYRGRYGKGGVVELKLEDAPVRGAAMASVTIVEFSDFQCPYCGAAHPEIERALREFEGRVRLVFKHYPLAGHPRAMPAALAAEAARLQGKFWPMHDLLFGHQDALQDADLLRYAERLGLDMKRFREDLGSDAVRRRVKANREEGRQAGVEATPTFYIGGRKFRETPRTLIAYLREELG